MTSLREELRDWTDVDQAQHCLSLCVGLMDPSVRFHLEAKHVYWTNNPVGDMLLGILEKLADVEVLEKRDEPDLQFRWNTQFKGSWQTSPSG
jgi:hypothetical protein